MNYKNKKVLILGSNSSVAKAILEEAVKQNLEIETCNRQQLDITNLVALKEKFKNNYYDLVIHCAMAGQGRIFVQDSPLDFYNNLIMQENLLYLSDHYSNLIVFSSGAQNSRSIDVIDLKEGYFNEPPNNYYSLAKYINAKRVIGNEKVINLRIFNAFTHFEKDNRFIKCNIIKYIKGQDIEIWGDAIFDFFYANDIYKVVEYFIQTPVDKYTEINLVYDKKYKFSQIADIINNLSYHKVNVFIKEGQNKHYSGNGENLKNLKLSLDGLHEGIRKTYHILKNERI